MMEKKIRRKRRKQKRRFMRNCLFTVMGTCLILTAVLTGSRFSFRAKATEGPETYKYFTEIRVASGMTLWDIARQYMSPEYPTIHDYIREVKEVNSIPTDEIYYGQSLMIPYYSEELK